MFQLTKNEWKELITICDNLPDGVQYSPATPFAFTEQGVAMLSSVLNSDRAVAVNIQIMRVFTKIRQMLTDNDGYLTDKDRKVALIISNIKGGGTELLNEFTENAKADLIENIVLWTDSTCNHSYYPKRGYELFFTDISKLEQSQDETIETMFYKKKIESDK